MWNRFHPTDNTISLIPADQASGYSEVLLRDGDGPGCCHGRFWRFRKTSWLWRFGGDDIRSAAPSAVVKLWPGRIVNDPRAKPPMTLAVSIPLPDAFAQNLGFALHDGFNHRFVFTLNGAHA